MSKGTLNSTKIGKSRARFNRSVLEIILSASRLTGRNKNDFIASTPKTAQKASEVPQIINLSVEDQIRFAKLLLSPPSPPSPALERAKEAYRQLIRHSTNG
jgi:uncharacterized protein (DUF1778 family)